MSASLLPTELRYACRIHAALLDQFIEITRLEIEKQPAGFVKDSLQELLDSLRTDRKHYGALASVIAVDNAA